jgi:hypothetical protein
MDVEDPLSTVINDFPNFIMITDPIQTRLRGGFFVHGRNLGYDDFQKLMCRCDSHGKVSLSSTFPHFSRFPDCASLLLIDTSHIPNQTHLPSLRPHNPSFLHTRNIIHPHPSLTTNPCTGVFHVPFITINTNSSICRPDAFNFNPTTGSPLELPHGGVPS